MAFSFSPRALPAEPVQSTLGKTRRIVIDTGRRTALALVPPRGNWPHIAALQNDHHNSESSSRFQEAFVETHE
jgi:hypothetical protein